MKKVTDFLKPNILIVFGALLLLYYLNWLQYQGAGLALGIIAIVLSAYYLAIGILGVIIGNKFSAGTKKIFDVISVSLFAAFMFTYFLLFTINGARNMGPTAWTINILSMIASLALIVVYILAKFANKDILLRFAYLFAAIFALALLLNILFDGNGNADVLGNLNILLVAIYVLFTFYLFDSLARNDASPAPKQVEEKEDNQEEPAKEEEPQEQENN